MGRMGGHARRSELDIEPLGQRFDFFMNCRPRVPAKLLDDQLSRNAFRPPVSVLKNSARPWT